MANSSYMTARLTTATTYYNMLHPDQQIHNQLNGTFKVAKHFTDDLAVLQSLMQRGRISSTVISKDDRAYTMLTKVKTQAKKVGTHQQ